MVPALGVVFLGLFFIKDHCFILQHGKQMSYDNIVMLLAPYKSNIVFSVEEILKITPSYSLDDFRVAFNHHNFLVASSTSISSASSKSRMRCSYMKKKLQVSPK
jgi:hypothetical protein